jgi:hypothetical protein
VLRRGNGLSDDLIAPSGAFVPLPAVAAGVSGGFAGPPAGFAGVAAVAFAGTALLARRRLRTRSRTQPAMSTTAAIAAYRE